MDTILFVLIVLIATVLATLPLHWWLRRLSGVSPAGALPSSDGMRWTGSVATNGSVDGAELPSVSVLVMTDTVHPDYGHLFAGDVVRLSGAYAREYELCGLGVRTDAEPTRTLAV